MKVQSILHLIGNTPLVHIARLNPYSDVSIWAKLESYNPGGSIKDRVALSMIESAERSGELTKEKIVIEATSGNTGIGLAMVCAYKGYELMLLMPESASEERKKIMSAYGAQIYLTPGHLNTDGAIEEAYRLAREFPEKYVLMDQFNNLASIDAHYQGTAQEVWDQTEGKVTHVVATLGTSGTAMGLAKRLKEYNSEIKIAAVEPYIGHKIQGLKNMQASYPPGIYNKKLLDQVLHVEDEAAFSLCRELARKEAIFAGMSSGAALGGALLLAAELERKQQKGNIVIILPDGGERYLSTSLFVPSSKQGLQLYNIKTRKEEIIDLHKSPVGIFTPSPSADKIEELESWRRLVFMDVLFCYLKSKDIECRAIVGTADMDDQALHQAHNWQQSLSKFSEQFINELQKIGNLLKLDTGVQFMPASFTKETMLNMCENLLGKGRGYEKLRSVYYDVFRDSEYGQLTRADLEKLSLGKTVDLEDYVKDNPRDFTLLKRASLKNLKAGEFIKTRWGNVRPSWYLQIAASAQDILDHLKIVIASRTHQFPHMDNLRAIWSKAAQIDPQIWVIVQTVSGEEDILSVYNALSKLKNPYVLRMWLLSISYRKPLIYSQDNLKMWYNNWKKVQNLVSNLALIQDKEGDVSKEVDQALFDLKTGFTDMVEEDLSIYRFWPVLFDFCKKIHNKFNKGELTSAEASAILKRIKSVDVALKIIDWQALPLMASQWPQSVSNLVEKRYEAKKVENYNRADELREELQKLGYLIEDTPYGVRVDRINDEDKPS